jgi:hypothetical protein
MYCLYLYFLGAEIGRIKINTVLPLLGNKREMRTNPRFLKVIPKRGVVQLLTSNRTRGLPGGRQGP